MVAVRGQQIAQAIAALGQQGIHFRVIQPELGVAYLRIGFAVGSGEGVIVANPVEAVGELAVVILPVDALAASG